MIEVKNITKKFGNNKVAVDNASWTAPDGAITGFIGHNGAGKTTTLNMITGVLQPTSGQILINGIDIEQEPLKAKEQFGFVSDSPDHFLRLKGIEYLNFIADVYNVPQQQRVDFIDKYAEKLQIKSALNSSILSYSHGMRQKIMMLGALIHNPSVWILDEPLTGLDPQAAFEIKKMMKEHTEQGNTVLFSTHVLEVAEKLCDKVIIISSGVMQFEGTLEQLKTKFSDEDSLESIFIKMSGGNQ